MTGKKAQWVLILHILILIAAIVDIAVRLSVQKIQATTVLLSHTNRVSSRPS
jgi:hypothetical protein